MCCSGGADPAALDFALGRIHGPFSCVRGICLISTEGIGLGKLVILDQFRH